MSWIENIKDNFEFLLSPKQDIGTRTMVLILGARNVLQAEKFCSQVCHGQLYEPDADYLKVVEFADSNGVTDFFMSLSDKLVEGTVRSQ